MAPKQMKTTGMLFKNIGLVLRQDTPNIETTLNELATFLIEQKINNVFIKLLFCPSPNGSNPRQTSLVPGSSECGMWNAECGVSILRIPHSAFRTGNTVAWAALALHQTSLASSINKKKIFATNYTNRSIKFSFLIRVIRVIRG